MYKIPTDSTDEDSITHKTYFSTRNTVTLDETVRNHGRQLSETTQAELSQAAITKQDSLPVEAPSNNIGEEGSPGSSTIGVDVAPSNNIGEEGSPGSSTIRVDVAPQPSNPPGNSMAKKSCSLSDAFSFIKETEFYDKEAVDKAAEENKKRKLERAPGSCEPKIVQPTEKSAKKHNQCTSGAMLVSTRQRGNSLLSHLRNVVVNYRDDILPDYIVGASAAVLFLSLKYHRLHPEYIYERLRQLGSGFTVRVLLLLVDIPDSAASIQELTKVALLSSCTLMLAWSPLEAARYLEAFKIYEHKPAEVLKGFKDMTYQGYLNGFLTSIRGVNKSDVNRLKSEFGSVKEVIHAEKGQLSYLHGIGEKKAERIYTIFQEPFKSTQQYGST